MRTRWLAAVVLLVTGCSSVEQTTERSLGAQVGYRPGEVLLVVAAMRSPLRRQAVEAALVDRLREIGVNAERWPSIDVEQVIDGKVDGMRVVTRSNAADALLLLWGDFETTTYRTVEKLRTSPFYSPETNKKTKRPDGIKGIIIDVLSQDNRYESYQALESENWMGFRASFYDLNRDEIVWSGVSKRRESGANSACFGAAAAIDTIDWLLREQILPGGRPFFPALNRISLCAFGKQNLPSSAD